MSDFRERHEAEVARLRGLAEAALAAGDPIEFAFRRMQLELLDYSMSQVLAARDSKTAQSDLVKLIALVKAYRRTGKSRPSLIEVAHEMAWESEQPLRDYCRELGIKDWHDVHPLMAALRD